MVLPRRVYRRRARDIDLMERECSTARKQWLKDKEPARPMTCSRLPPVSYSRFSISAGNRDCPKHTGQSPTWPDKGRWAIALLDGLAAGTKRAHNQCRRTMSGPILSAWQRKKFQKTMREGSSLTLPFVLDGPGLLPRSLPKILLSVLRGSWNMRTRLAASDPKPSNLRGRRPDRRA